MLLLLLPIVTQACNSAIYPTVPSVYVSNGPLSGDGSECFPYNSLLSALNILKSTGGIVLLQAPIASFSLPAITLSSTVEIRGSNHTLTLAATLFIAIGSTLTITDVKMIGNSGLSGVGVEVGGGVVLTRCTVSGFLVPFLHLLGVLVVELGDFSNNSQTVIVAEGLAVVITIEGAVFVGNTGPNAAILDYQLSALRANAALPTLTLANLQVSLYSLVPAFYIQFSLSDVPSTHGLVTIAGGKYSSYAEVLVCSVTGLDLMLEGVAVTSSSAGLLVTSTDSPVTVLNTSFERVTGKGIGRNGGKCGSFL